MYKEIEGFDGHYFIKEDGTVISVAKGVEKVLTQHDNGFGYMTVNLWKGNKGHMRYVHRLVAEAFLDNPNHYKYVDHINTIKDDNRVENLRWVTAKLNYHNPITKEKMRIARSDPEYKKKMAERMSGENNPAYTHREKNNFVKNNPQAKKPIICEETGVIYDSACDAYKETGICRATINKCCNNKQITAGGYHWKYINL